MDDLAYGARNKRGDWTPGAFLTIAPVFVLPPRPLAFLKWLPGYFLPWNLLFAASAVAYAAFVLPDVEVTKTLAWGWILRLFVVNCLAVFLFYSAFEYRLYISRAQGSGRPMKSGSSSPSPRATRPGSPSRSIPSISVALRCSCRSSTSSISFAFIG